MAGAASKITHVQSAQPPWMKAWLTQSVARRTSSDPARRACSTLLPAVKLPGKTTGATPNSSISFMFLYPDEPVLSASCFFAMGNNARQKETKQNHISPASRRAMGDKGIQKESNGQKSFWPSVHEPREAREDKGTLSRIISAHHPQEPWETNGSRIISAQHPVKPLETKGDKASPASRRAMGDKEKQRETKQNHLSPAWLELHEKSSRISFLERKCSRNTEGSIRPISDVNDITSERSDHHQDPPQARLHLLRLLRLARPLEAEVTEVSVL